MAGGKFALLVATNRYEEYTELGRLRAPANDAHGLATVLRNHQIAGFEVKTLNNRPHHQVAKAIGEFYAGRGRDDLVLLYFTGHGVKDEGGRLYLATTDTRISNLRFTAVQAEQVSAAMNECRSGQKVLILDCCFAGAFPSGFDPKSDQRPVNAVEQLAGRGSVVLTSSDALQYSFEGNGVTEVGSASSLQKPTSLFTRIMVEGLKTGAADLNRDGDITLDELYGYVNDRVVSEQPHQHPQMKADFHGRICIAQNVGWTLPSHVVSAMEDEHSSREVRLSALKELRGLHSRGNALVRQRVLEAVRRFTEDDSTQVKRAASQLLSELAVPDGQSLAGEDPAPSVTGRARTGSRDPGLRRGGKRSASAAARLAAAQAEQKQRQLDERSRYKAEQKQREVEERARAAGQRAEREWQESVRYALQEVLSSAQRAESRQRPPEVPGPAERPEGSNTQKAIIEDSSPGIVSPRHASSGGAPPGSAPGQALADTLREGSHRFILAWIGLLTVVLIALVAMLLAMK